MDEIWKKQLRREASSHGMCEENRIALSQVTSKKDAIELYKKTIDWALEQGYPSLNTIRSFFSDCEEYGIYVDKTFHGEELLEHQVYVFHNCQGTIRVGLNTEKKIIPMLYFANGCKMKVESAGPKELAVKVPLYIFDDCMVRGEASEDIECRIFNFSTEK